MTASPSVAAALVSVCVSSEPFTEQSVNSLFRACITATGVEFDCPQGLDLFEQLWYSDSVLAAIEALKEAHDGDRETGSGRRRLLASIDAEILQLA